LVSASMRHGQISSNAVSNGQSNVINSNNFNPGTLHYIVNVIFIEVCCVQGV